MLKKLPFLILSTLLVSLLSASALLLPAEQKFERAREAITQLNMQNQLAQASGSGAGIQRQGRWFTYNGQYVYYVGADTQQLAADTSLDYISILNQFQANGINKVRIWVDAYWDLNYLHPWVYNASTAKYNLDQWNNTYWTRLKAVVSAAQQRNIIVEISIFDAYPESPNWFVNDTMRVAWNKSYNSNGAFSANSSGHFYPEFYDLNSTEKSTSGKTIKDYQQALVDKTLSELGGYPNVYFEIMNEFFERVSTFPNGFATIAPWQQYWANYIAQRTDRLVVTHVHDATNSQANKTVGQEYFWDMPSVDVLNYHLYQTDPGTISSMLNAAQRKGKVLQNNESYEWYVKNPDGSGQVTQANLDKVTKEAWGWFLSGGYYGFYNAQHTEYTNWSQLGTRAKVLHDLAAKVRFWEMSPVDSSGNEYDSLVTQGPGSSNTARQVFANPGSQYVVYFWGTPRTTNVSIQLPTGSYRYEWYDPRSGNLISSGTVTGGSATTITSPGTSTWSGAVGVALFIFAETTTPTVTLTTNPTSITQGQSSTLTWSSTNATSCTASGGWTGTKTTSGTQAVSPTANTTYTITCTGAGGSANQSVTVAVSSSGGGGTTTPPPPTGTLCNTYTSNSTPPTGYGVAYNLFSAARELILNVTCNTDASVKLESGNAQNTTYIWHQAYYTKNARDWVPVSLTGADTAGGGLWIIGTANVTEAMTTAEQQTQNYFASYVCVYTNSTWKCGCQDATCAVPSWNLQGFKK